MGGARGRLARAMDLPPDVVFDLPRITLVGHMQLTVEHHRGIRAFSAERLVVATDSGLLVVEGEDLRLGVLRDGEVSVTGTLGGIRFDR